jgi:DNA replication protein DnaC
MPTSIAEALDWYMQDLDKRYALQHNGRVLEIARKMGARYAPDCVGLDRYVVVHQGQAQTVAQLRALASRLKDSIRAGENLVLFGTCGTGKDFLLASMLYIAGDSGCPLRFARGSAILQARSDQDRAEATAVALLGWSDPVPPGGLPGWQVNNLFDVLDARYAAMKSTWLTINAEDEDDAAARLTIPVWDRLRHHGIALPCYWPSFRTETESK